MSCVCGLLYGFHPMSLTEMERAAIVNLDSEMFQKKGWKRASLMWLRIDCWSASRRPWRAETLLARISTPNFPLSTLTSSQTDTLSLYTWHLLKSEKQGRPWQSWVPFILIGLLRSGIAFGVMDLCVCVYVWWQVFTYITLRSSITSEIFRGQIIFFGGVHIKK